MMRPLAVTMGEPAGIGGEIVLKAWLDRAQGVPAFFLVDDEARIAALASRLGLAVPTVRVGSGDAALDAFPNALPVMQCPLSRMPDPGRPDTANARAVIDSIERAVRSASIGDAAAVVTNPIHKKTLYGAGFRFPGHTEFLASLAGARVRAVMMLASPTLRVVPVTVHASLRQAIATLRTDDIVFVAETTWEALRRDFGMSSPRLAVAGLNPHAGEEGEMGDEEDIIIAPAISRLRRNGITVAGPLPPDAMFAPHVRDSYDAAICMYHDQGLIPLKALDFDGGVNVTLGLPFVRTSPDHGTALDIAGSGRASAKSLIAAMRMAVAVAKRRADFGAREPAA
jgi:4-hydroxythreonine-4-phosphate dehydrogenase